MKGRYAHTVDLNPFAEACLREAVAASPGKPFPFSYWYVLKRWVVTRDAAGFPDVRIHDLRHSFVSNQLDAGTPIHVVRDMAAHRSLVVTGLYAHGTDEARRAAASRVQIAVPAVTPKLHLVSPAVSPREKPQGANPAASLDSQVPRDGIEPPTRGFSVPCSTN